MMKSIKSAIIFSIFLIIMSVVYANPQGTNIVISELGINPSFGADTGDTGKEFIELYNPTNSNINIGGWKFKFTTEGTSYNTNITVPQNSIVEAHSLFLIADTGGNGWPSNWSDPDLFFNIQLNNVDYGVALLDQSNNVVDSVGWGSPATTCQSYPCFETQTLSNPVGGYFERKPGYTSELCGNSIDTNNNKNDFLDKSDSDAQNSEFIEDPADCEIIPPDTTPPSQITNLRAINVTNTSVTWAWNNPSDSDFDKSIVYVNNQNLINTSQENVLVYDLAPNTQYTIRINTKDTNGNINYINVTNTAATLSNPNDPNPDTTPPSINIVSVNGDQTQPYTTDDNITTFIINLNEAGDCRMSDLDESYAAMTDNYDCTGDNTTQSNCQHPEQQDGSYSVYIACRDLSGNTNSNSNNLQVQYIIDAVTEPVSGELSISNLAVSSITNQSAIISWTTNNFTDSMIYYGLTDSYEEGNVYYSDLGLSHAIQLEGLKANTVYKFLARSCDSEDNCANSALLQPNNFRTQRNIITPADDDFQVNYIRGKIIIGGQNAPSGTNYRIEVLEANNTINEFEGQIDENVPSFLNNNGFFDTLDQPIFSTGYSFRLSSSACTGTVQEIFLNGGNGDFLNQSSLITLDCAVCTDNDSDGYNSNGLVCGPIDCNDNNNQIYPGAVELCDNIDNDCDGNIDENLTRATSCGVGVCAGNTGIETCSAGVWGSNTCNAFTGASAEICDSTDNNCNGQTDENLTRSTSCGIGVCAGNTGIETCSLGNWGSNTCNALAGASSELCDNIDNDCDGSTDENLTRSTSCGIGVCAGNTGIETCSLGNWQGNTCNPIARASAELCDNIDNDCDGSTDENLTQATSCGVGICSSTGIETCSLGNWQGNTCNPIAQATDETCDDLDNDCDGSTDEEDAIGCTDYYYDFDQDAFGISDSKCLCAAENKYTSNNEDDCDDTRNLVYPGADEICDGLDNDCNTQVDEGLVPPSADKNKGVCIGQIKTCQGTSGWQEPNYYLIINYEQNEAACDNIDNDCDGNTDESLTRQTTCGVGQCAGNIGHETCSSGIWGSNTCNPIARASAELCDNIDNDCDGSTDENFPDTDNDGQVDCIDTDLDGDNTNNNADNCRNDYNPDQLDSDFDGIGDVCDLKKYDKDKDGYEDIANNGDDCNDNDRSINPGAKEIIDNIDQNCINDAPFIDVDDFVVVAGDKVIIPIENIQDPEGDSITYSISSPVENDGVWKTEKSNIGVHTVVITASDSYLTSSKEIEIEVVKKIYNQVSVNRIRTSELYVKPGENLEVNIDLSNEGITDLKSLTVSAVVQELGIRETEKQSKLKKSRDANIDFSLAIPQWAPKGEYMVRITIANDKVRRIIHRPFIIK